MDSSLIILIKRVSDGMILIEKEGYFEVKKV